MLKEGDSAHREDRRVKGVKIRKSLWDREISHVCLAVRGYMAFQYWLPVYRELNLKQRSGTLETCFSYIDYFLFTSISVVNSDWYNWNYPRKLMTFELPCLSLLADCFAWWTLTRFDSILKKYCLIGINWPHIINRIFLSFVNYPPIQMSTKACWKWWTWLSLWALRNYPLANLRHI